MDAHLPEPLRIGALCAETAASWSTLQRAFARICGLTPKAALDLRRMSVARQLLLAGSPEESTVAALVHGCGIHHMSRFSVRYQALYGERPSATLARTAPRPGIRNPGPVGMNDGPGARERSRLE
jgi:AraC family ethanolamine operon transcriptional activator